MALFIQGSLDPVNCNAMMLFCAVVVVVEAAGRLVVVVFTVVAVEFATTVVDDDAGEVVVEVCAAALNVRTSCGGSPLFVSGGISDVGNDGNGFVMAEPVAVVAPLAVMETVT